MSFISRTDTHAHFATQNIKMDPEFSLQPTLPCSAENVIEVFNMNKNTSTMHSTNCFLRIQ